MGNSFGSAISDGGFGVVFSAARPSVLPFLAGSSTIWTAMPAAVTEFMGSTIRRFYSNLSGFTNIEAWTMLAVPGVAGSVVRFQYTLDFSGATGWTDLSTNISLTSAGVPRSTVAAIPEAAKTSVLIRIVGELGNAAANPQFLSIQAILT